MWMLWRSESGFCCCIDTGWFHAGIFSPIGSGFACMLLCVWRVGREGKAGMVGGVCVREFVSLVSFFHAILM